MKKRENFEVTVVPNHFKKIGLAIILGAVGFSILFKTANIEILQSHKALCKLMSINSLIFGLLLIVMAKDKIEDEMTMQIRLKVMSYTFIGTVFYVLTLTIWNFYDSSMRPMDAHGVVLSMLIMYLINSFIQKKLLK
jgi:hypothetical protein